MIKMIIASIVMIIVLISGLILIIKYWLPVVDALISGFFFDDDKSLKKYRATVFSIVFVSCSLWTGIVLVIFVKLLPYIGIIV